MQESFPERLRRLLNEKHYGKSETAWARESGVDFKTLRRALEGDGTPRYPTMQKLADYLGVSYEYLATGEGSPEPGPANLDELKEKFDQALDLMESIRRDLDARDSNGNR